MRLDPSPLPSADSTMHPPRLEVDAVPGFISARLSRAKALLTSVSLAGARGRVLGGDVVAPTALPPFDHSAMDGYALRHADLTDRDALIPVVASADADSACSAVRVFTGSAIPDGTESVVMQEHVERIGEAIRLKRAASAGANIRRAGEDVLQGARVLSVGQVLDVRHLALLAALGIERVTVARRLRVAVVALGTELVPPGGLRADAQVFDANSTMAAAFFTRHGCDVVSEIRVADEPLAIARTLQDLEGTVDLIVTSGGMADGDRDYTHASLMDLGGTWRTLGVNMKPGKPASIGTLGDTTVLGLPGNPFAALVGLIVIGGPILCALDGRRPFLTREQGNAGFDLDRRSGRAEFFPARRELSSDRRTVIRRLGKGGSARLQPLLEADALGYIAGAAGAIRHGDPIAYLPLDRLL